MALAQGTNWLVVTGLLFALYGSVMLASAIYGGAMWAGSDSDAAKLGAERQKVTAWYGGVLLALGFGLQALGHVATAGLTGLIPVLLIGLIVYLFAYLLAVDAAANRPLSALGALADAARAPVASAPGTETKAEVLAEVEPAAATKLRVAS